VFNHKTHNPGTLWRQPSTPIPTAKQATHVSNLICGPPQRPPHLARWGMEYHAVSRVLEWARTGGRILFRIPRLGKATPNSSQRCLHYFLNQSPTPLWSHTNFHYISIFVAQSSLKHNTSVSFRVKSHFRIFKRKNSFQLTYIGGEDGQNMEAHMNTYTFLHWKNLLKLLTIYRYAWLGLA
jgi:hypothetical protein